MLFGPDYEKINGRLLDSLIYGIISTPLYNSNSPTLDEALNTGQVSIIQSDSRRTQRGLTTACTNMTPITFSG